MKASGQTGCQRLMQGAQKSASRRRAVTWNRCHGLVGGSRYCRRRSGCARHRRRRPGAKTRAAQWARTASGPRLQRYAQRFAVWRERHHRRCAWPDHHRCRCDPPPLPALARGRRRQASAVRPAAAQAAACRPLGPAAAARPSAQSVRQGLQQVVVQRCGGAGRRDQVWPSDQGQTVIRRRRPDSEFRRRERPPIRGRAPRGRQRRPRQPQRKGRDRRSLRHPARGRDRGRLQRTLRAERLQGQSSPLAFQWGGTLSFSGDGGMQPGRERARHYKLTS